MSVVKHRKQKILAVLLWLLTISPVAAQIAPSEFELASYDGIFADLLKPDTGPLQQALAEGTDVNRIDGYQRTALHVAAYLGNHDAMRLLIAAGADANALERDFYDIVTIAAVANDLPTLRLALELGCRPTNITSRYEGTALIAAAHLGHVEVVQTLIEAGAPLNHVNNLAWTALVEAIVLGDGGARHTATLKALVEAGANVNLADGQGLSPLRLAEDRGYTEMARLLRRAGARR